jgi:predicted MFS family arabinose efflux permease
MADEVLRGGASTYGLLLTAQGVGAVAGALTLASLGDTPRKRALVYFGLALFCAALFAFSLSRHPWLSAAFLGISGAGMILFSATSNTVVQTMVPDELRGRVMGIWALIFAGSTPIGSMQAGTLARLFGAPRTIQIGAAAMALGGILVFLSSQRDRARLRAASRR